MNNDCDDNQEESIRRVKNLAISRAGNSNADGAGSAVAGEANDANVVAEVLATELGTNAHLLGQLLDLVLPLEVTESTTPNENEDRDEDEGQDMERDEEKRVMAKTNCLLPEVWRLSRYLEEAILTVLRVISADRPPITTARW